MNSGEIAPAAGSGVALDRLFGPAGPLAAALENFAPRPEQLAMAEAVANAMRDSANLVVEAGTGTGKTLAYLVPLLLAGKRAVISTGTRTLQDQLFHRDLPMLCSTLGRPVRVRLLKGRGNYLCRYRLQQLDESAELPAQVSRDDLRVVRAWAQGTVDGDLAELTGIREQSGLTSRITSTADNCLGSQCAFIDDCHVARARQAARDADIVVVNHHLLLADLTMKEDGFGQLLPGAEAIVVDEAHNFPEIAQGFFDRSLAAGQLFDLISDVRAEALSAGAWSAGLQRRLDDVGTALRAARACLGDDSAHLGWDSAGEEFAEAFDQLAERLAGMEGELAELADAGIGLRRCRERAGLMAGRAGEILDATGDDMLRWLRVGSRGFTASLTPLDASGQLRSLLEAQAGTWIFTSATLAVGEDFGHFVDRLGLASLRTRQVPSPFDFGRIARLYLPGALPEPSAPDFTECMLSAARPVLEASRGRAFLLFTSHRALRRAAELLRADTDFRYPLLVQGESPRSRLLERFAKLDDAVLLGSATFWEGVDIRGHGLVLVVIDRLPFASPGDPLLSARLQAIRDRGGNPFRDYQLPQAVLSLKQGVGRLIRDYTDFGVVMICDPRLQTRSYGRVFLQSLPPMPVVRDVDDVVAFLHDQELPQ